MTGKLITLEGIECCGKGTQAQLLWNYLRQKKISARLLHEPGGTPYGEALRAILKYPSGALNALYCEFDGHSDFPDFGRLAAMREVGTLDLSRTPECELFLFEAARAEYAKAIKQILQSGEHVISDRLHDSTTAYQGGGRGLPLSTIDDLNRIALSGLWPDLTILLDIPVETMLERVGRQDDQKNAYFEKTETREFFERVRQAYLDIAKRDPDRIAVIDGTQSIEQVFGEIRIWVDELLANEG